MTNPILDAVPDNDQELMNDHITWDILSEEIEN